MNSYISSFQLLITFNFYKDNVVQLKALGFIVLLFISQLAFASSTFRQITHSLNVSSNVYEGDNISVSWAPLSQFSDINFSFVKLGYRINGGGWNFTDYRGSSTSIRANQSGNWCFIVRGWDSEANHFGSFGSESCTNVQTLPIPNPPSVPSGPTYHPIKSDFSIFWNSMPYAHSYKINGVPVGGTNETFNFETYGRRSFQVEACNANGECSASSPIKYVFVYTGPGEVKVPSFSKSPVEVGEVYTIYWQQPGGVVPGAYYIVKRDGFPIYTGSDLKTTDQIDTPGSYTYSIESCNPGICGGVVYKIQQVIAPVQKPNLSINRNGKDNVYIPINSVFDFNWNTHNGEQYTLTETFNGSTSTISSHPVMNYSKSSYGNYTYQVKAENSLGYVNSDPKVVVVYTSPGFVKDLSVDKVEIFENEVFTINWSDAGGIIHSSDYEVTLNGTLLQKSKDTFYQGKQENPGTYIYTIAACNPDLDCTESIIEVVVKMPDEVIGSADFVYEDKRKKILDPYYNKNEILAWDISLVKNATHYKVMVIKENITYEFPAIISSDKKYATFQFLENINKFKTNDKVKVYLIACTQSCTLKPISNPVEIILVNWELVQYFTGSPLHVLGAAVEASEYGTFTFNKLWKTVEQNSLSRDFPKFIYDIDPKEFFDAYWHTYNIPDKESYYLRPTTVPTIDVTKPLFDGVAFWNNIMKKSEYFPNATRLGNVFTDDVVQRFRADPLDNMVRQYLDNIFGVKYTVSLENRRYLFKNKKSLLNGMHESASAIPFDSDSSIVTKRGFYIVLPVPYYNDTDLPFLEEEFKKRYKNYIDEIIEQYTLWLDLDENKNTNIRLAGFVYGGESTDTKTVKLITYLQQYIKSFSNELEYVATGYRRGPDVSKPFKDRCKNLSLEECLPLFTWLSDIKVSELFDRIWIQPNATVERFGSHKNISLQTASFDREVLHWLGHSLFEKVKDNPKYSVLFEYTRNLADGRNSSREYFGFPVEVPERYGNFMNYTHKSNGARFDDDQYSSGFYGDISYYADYIATDFPPNYSNGKKPIYYDDNGGVFYCYVQYALGKEDSCDAVLYKEKRDPSGAWVGALVNPYDLVESISDVRSMYSFIGKTRGYESTYEGDNKLSANTPIIPVKVNSTRSLEIKTKSLDTEEVITTEDIPIGNATKIHFNTLVRARLKNNIAFYDYPSHVSSCSAMPMVKLNFKNNRDIIIDSHIEYLSADVFLDACKNFRHIRETQEDIEAERVALEKQRIIDECPVDKHKEECEAEADEVKAQWMGEWITVNQWLPISAHINFPSGTHKFSIELETDQINSMNTVEEFVFYRPDYKLY